MKLDISAELAEEIGWHIGDGSMNYYRNKGTLKGVYQLRDHIEDDRLHYINIIKPLFDKLYNTNISLREMPSTRVYGFQIWRDGIVKFKQLIGLPLGKKTNITIPKHFLKNSSLKKAIIRGIFDTDGCLYLENKNKKIYPRIEIRTISFNLSQQLFDTLSGLGFRTTRHPERVNKEFNRQLTYLVSIRGVEMLHKFMEDIDPKNQKHILKYRKFLSFEKI